MMTMAWKLGEFLKDELDKKGWNMSTLASKADLSPSYVRDLLRGENPKTGKPPSVSLDTTISICKALNIPIESFIAAYQGKTLTEKELEKEAAYGIKDTFFQMFADTLKKQYPNPKERMKKITELLGGNDQ